MAILVGSKTVMGPNIDKRLDGKLFVLATTIIPDDVIRLMSMGIWGVAEQLEHDNLLGNLARVNCIVTEYGEVTLKLSENQLANVMSLITYPIQKWKDRNTSELHMLLFIVEELCHHYWNIEDELEVNYKVLEVIKRILPDTEMSDLYSVDWMERELENKRNET